MSVVQDPERPGFIKFEQVKAEITTDAPVHRCDRCGTEAPRAVRTAGVVETDSSWKAGTVALESLPAEWSEYWTGGDKSRSLELCPSCYRIVERLRLEFIETAGLLR